MDNNTPPQATSSALIQQASPAAATATNAGGLTVTALTRVFKDGGVVLRDPAPGSGLEQAIRILASTGRPHLAKAEIRGPEQQGDKLVYTLHRQVGTKGSTEGGSKGILPGMTTAKSRVRIQGRMQSVRNLRSYKKFEVAPASSPEVVKDLMAISSNEGEHHLALPSDATPWVC